MKNLIKKYLNDFYKVLSLQTGFRSGYTYLIVLLTLISILSIFLRKDILINLDPKVFSLIIMCGVCNVVYIQFNLMCRITLVILKGKSYFVEELVKNENVNIRKYTLYLFHF